MQGPGVPFFNIVQVEGFFGPPMEPWRFWIWNLVFCSIHYCLGDCSKEEGLVNVLLNDDAALEEKFEPFYYIFK